jgi:hypothetical protein
MAARPTTSTPSPVHAFKPTSGTVMGYVGLVTAAAVAVLALVSEPNATGLRTALVAALVGLLVWMVMLRPRVRAYADTLLLKNMTSDTVLPLARVDNVLVRHTLNVWVGDRRYTCAGIGRSTRNMLGAKGRGPAVGGGGHDYPSFVETTIEDLAHAARRDLQGEPPPVTRRWAVPELAALGGLVAALLLSLLL